MRLLVDHADAQKGVSSVAITQALPLYANVEQRAEHKILRFPARTRETETVEIVVGMKRIWLMMTCPRHAWSWPRLNKGEERFPGFDAHQTCHKCTSRRFFDSRAWEAGPLFLLRHQHAPSEVRPIQKKAGWTRFRHANSPIARRLL
jgi:hypothetical protein